MAEDDRSGYLTPDRRRRDVTMRRIDATLVSARGVGETVVFSVKVGHCAGLTHE